MNISENNTEIYKVYTHKALVIRKASVQEKWKNLWSSIDNLMLSK